ncbi:hypothetical protein KZO25_09520 [Halomonas sp. ANAO-440]|uniref:spike base protein, RCAP_Rcc01079 family n=1 Tax=Halomonas sp. ANAO-440 TaxID=2861360 RepID=UPI001CAA5AC2|nr:hypothetical protein [Halomonas sp. ANAO-440]MBZ0330557.1 hypothetical protein [Halomonas sp. ANAO-440]
MYATSSLSHHTSPPANAQVLTPSDSMQYEGGVMIRAGQAGDVTVEPLGGQVPITFSLEAGAFVPVRVRRVMATGTTATDLVAVWWGEQGSELPKAEPLLTYFTAGDEGTLVLTRENGRRYRSVALETEAGSNDPVGRVLGDLEGDVGATQTTSESRPTYSADFGMLSHDGIDDFMTTGVERFGSTGLFVAPDESFFLAVVIQGAADVSGVIVDKSTALAFKDTTFRLDRVSGDGQVRIVLRREDTRFDWPVNDNEPHVIWVQWDGFQATGGYDSLEPQVLNAGKVESERSADILFGARTSASPSFNWTGDIGSRIVIDRAVTMEERESIIANLLSRHQFEEESQYSVYLNEEGAVLVDDEVHALSEDY